MNKRKRRRATVVKPVSVLVLIGSLFLFVSYLVFTAFVSVLVGSLAASYGADMILLVAASVSTVEFAVSLLLFKPGPIFLAFVAPILLTAIAINRVYSSEYVHSIVNKVMDSIHRPILPVR
jgi:hypothetical protein